MNANLKRLLAVLAVPAVLLATMTRAAAPTAVSWTPINAVPPNVVAAPARPVVMLNLSRDHQLFYRAYNEFSDYDGDGRPDGTYLHTVRYSGYFDPQKCYAYSGTSRRFEPSTVLAARTDFCSGAWHGNFLNWATMTRMDVVRKVLYGGTRSTDTATATVLERVPLPMDAHSFAKHYVNLPVETAARPNISRLTPFTETEVTFCNTTTGDAGQTSQAMSTATWPPLLRAVRGNYSLWNAHERRQCAWDGERADMGWWDEPAGNGNDFAITGLTAQSGLPPRSAALSGGDRGDFVVRVAVCNPSLLGSERCKAYGTSLKPIGLLQEYGDTDQAEFGLMTGSYSRNTSGGVLRKNVSSFRSEVRAADGTFVAGANGIVHNLDRLRVWGMRYADNSYAANDNAGRSDQFCDFQTIGLVDNMCASWGNPMGEMFVEVLRYLRGNQGAGYGPASAYGGGADAKGAELGLTVASWTDPFTRGSAVDSAFGLPQCRPINTVHFNASVTSYDRDTLGPFGDLGAASSIATYTDQIGAGEGLHGTQRFIGRNDTAASNNACTQKTIGQLSAVDGLCPTAPAYRGSFSLAGAAYWANTNAIRPLPTGLNADDAARAYRVRSYGVALAPGVPRITVRTGGTNPLTAVIQPTYQLDHPSRGRGSGTLVDFRVISQTATSGRYLIVWEDSEQGGDYDQDVSGILEWTLSGTTLQVTTRVFAAATGNPQGFGYVTTGTNRDGVHFHSGIYGFDFTDPTGAPGCSDCQEDQPATTATYTVAGAGNLELQDPLWYAAKWGGFRAADGRPAASGAVPTQAQWDAVNNDTQAAGPDGVPDNYFVVFNPDQLERSLRQVFTVALDTSNATPAVSSTQLVGGSFKYVSSFDNGRASGDVEAFRINSSGNFDVNPTWVASTQLATVTPANRQVISNDGATGFSFDWSTLNLPARSTYLARLTAGTTTLTSQQAQQMVAFMRGDRTVETSPDIRDRPSGNVLGPIVNSSPWLQGAPSARFLDTRHPGYSTFANASANRSRTPLLWVGGGDGMLHAFNGNTGAPVLSYVPEILAARLNETIREGQGVRAFVDGSPFAADVDINAGVSTTPAWRTYVFATLGRGGRGIVALDATNPSQLTAANAANVFRWDFSANDDADFGHVISDIAVEPATGQASPVVKLQNGRFAVVVGNGLNSSNGRAALFILPVQGPSGTDWAGRYWKITLDAGPNNGLSTPVLLDLNNDGMVDTAYAGDLQGNLWKIDLSSANPADWRSAYRTTGGTPEPLYVLTTATLAVTPGTRLPITAAPQVAFPSFGGQVVTVASGRSIDAADFPRTDRVQRVVGIWDRPAFATRTRDLPRNVATLQPRTLTRLTGGQVTASGTAAIDYQNANATLARDGWYFDLPGSSEMVVSNIGFRAGSVFFNSIRPPGATVDCAARPGSTLYLFDPISGLPSRRLLGTVDVGGIATSVMGVEVADQKLRDVGDDTRDTRGLPGVPPCTGTNCTPAPVCPDGSAATRYVGGSTDVFTCTPQTTARLQWREIPGLRTRP